MLSFEAIAPDFLIILLGALIKRFFKFDESFWRQTEKLVFYVLLPSLLFKQVSTSNLDLVNSSGFILLAVLIMLSGVVMSYVAGLVTKNELTRASIFQCGFRFNNYIAFSLALRILGEEGVSLLAFIIAFWVPISNVLAVSYLARAVEKVRGKTTGEKKSLFEVVATNPLILATVLGLITNIAEIKIPNLASDFLNGLGKAALAMGLLCIGAGLKLNALKGAYSVIVANSVVRLIVLPLVAYITLKLLDVEGVKAAVILLFAAVPTAQSCFVMTSAMGGDAETVANATTIQVVAAIFTLWAWMFAIESFLS